MIEELVVPTTQATGTEYFSVDIKDELAAGSRPGPVVDLRPQERVLQHTVEHADAICPFVQILDAPVPQMGEQLVHFFKVLGTIDDIIQPRLVDRDLRVPQIAEQWVEVPTVSSFPSLQQQTVEHISKIPVPSGRGGSGSPRTELFSVLRADH